MSNSEGKTGKLVISLDLELNWGMFDKNQDGHYNRNIEAVHEVVPKLLKLFSEYEIHATWATIGMMMFEDKADLQKELPEVKPEYRNSEYSSYEYMEKNDIKPQLHFAPELVRKIVATEGQELASHTFSHYYCLEEQESTEGSEAAFRADCQAENAIMSHYDVTPKSIVFPRNQWTKQALEIVSEFDIRSYRGNEHHFLYRARRESSQTSLFIRGLRLIDHYLNISGHHTYEPSLTENPINLPASRFLRPYSRKLFFLEPLRLRRIKESMTHAAKNGEVFHLWWHPHNFGANQKQNFRNLTKLLKHYKKLEKKYGLESRNMAELAKS